jgi:hypothetical protein
VPALTDRGWEEGAQRRYVAAERGSRAPRRDGTRSGVRFRTMRPLTFVLVHVELGHPHGATARIGTRAPRRSTGRCA